MNSSTAKIKYNYLSIICLLLVNHLCVFSSCGQTGNSSSVISPDTIAYKSANFDSTQISLFLIQYPKLKRYENEIFTFYRNRGYSYAWFQDNKLVEQAGNLTNRILNLKDDGVYKQLSYAGILDSLIYEDRPASSSNIHVELLLTAEYFVFSSLVWEGMNPFVSKENS